MVKERKEEKADTTTDTLMKMMLLTMQILRHNIRNKGITNTHPPW